MTSADYDFKILKELRADYQGEEEESKEVKETKDKEQEKLIEGNFLHDNLCFNTAPR